MQVGDTSRRGHDIQFHAVPGENSQMSTFPDQQASKNLTMSRQPGNDKLYQCSSSKIDWVIIAEALKHTDACKQKHRQITNDLWSKKQDLALIGMVRKMSANNQLNWEKIAARMKEYRITSAAECQERFFEINKNALNYHCGQKSTRKIDDSKMENQPDKMG